VCEYVEQTRTALLNISLNLKGIKIHYVEKGDKSKPLMLFVHGFPEFWYSWRYQLKEFSKDYYVIAIDQRGYAESDKPQNVSDYHIDCMVGDIRQFVKQLGESSNSYQSSLHCYQPGAYHLIKHFLL
jgi:pimeloyl-ACP methyl ester carboxylesterase